ncbi:MAG: ribbon-helix-helix domain-containing protein [Candidatus Omnitrophica bacterium]|nr:ribbon-helix-helix domain-containing protein [Candidatus Omnitrophota bacterium]
MLIKYSTKLGQKEVRVLRRLSEQTRIPQSRLLEEAIQLLEAQFANDVVTPEFRRMADRSIQRNLPLLKRLAE